MSIHRIDWFYVNKSESSDLEPLESMLPICSAGSYPCCDNHKPSSLWSKSGYSFSRQIHWLSGNQSNSVTLPDSTSISFSRLWRWWPRSGAERKCTRSMIQHERPTGDYWRPVCLWRLSTRSWQQHLPLAQSDLTPESDQ